MKKKYLAYFILGLGVLCFAMTCAKEGTCTLTYVGECRENGLIVTEEEWGYMTRAECESEYDEAQAAMSGETGCEVVMHWVEN